MPRLVEGLPDDWLNEASRAIWTIIPPIRVHRLRTSHRIAIVVVDRSVRRRTSTGCLGHDGKAKIRGWNNQNSRSGKSGPRESNNVKERKENCGRGHIEETDEGRLRKKSGLQRAACGADDRQPAHCCAAMTYGGRCGHQRALSTNDQASHRVISPRLA